MVRLPRNRRLRIALATSLALLLLAGLVPIISHAWVERATRTCIYTDITQLPANNVGLVLGASRLLPDGQPNHYFLSRIRAAADLYRHGKIRHILASGDNHIQSYDEPSDMKAALLEQGVPEAAITLDYAGFRTFDSIVRAQKVFGQDRLTIITQPAHARRAAYIARHCGVDAVAYCAADIAFGRALKTQLREYLAQTKVLLDLHVLQTKPRFLGPPVTIGQ